MEFLRGLFGIKNAPTSVAKPLAVPPVTSERPAPKPEDYIHCVVCAKQAPRFWYDSSYRGKSTMGFTKICDGCAAAVKKWDSWSEESLARRIEDPVKLVNVFYASNTRRKNKNRRIDVARGRRHTAVRKGANKLSLLRASRMKELRPDASFVVRKRTSKNTLPCTV